MANCNNLFQEFNKTIRLDNDKRITLRERRDNLRSRINNGFNELKQARYFLESLNVSVEEEMEFQSQGSYVMDTIINPSRKDDEYDIDDGIYFMGYRDTQSRPNEQEFHDFVIASIEQGKGAYQIEKIEDKKTCVRVRYKGDNGDFNYHVDLPIYYATNVRTPELADTAEKWKVSNPIEFIVWFEELIQSGFKAEFILERALYEKEYEEWLNDRRKKDHQLRRIVRYLKAWGDHLKEDMPPGVVMTILAGSDSNYQADERDDICLRNTLVNIRNWLMNNGFTCPRPTTPKGEDLFRGYSQQKKDYFKSALDSFITNANQALENPNQKDACLKWQKHLGNRFPCFLAKDEIEGAKSYVAPAVIKSDNSRKCMINHEEAKKKAFESLKKIESVRVLSEEERQLVLPGLTPIDVWEVETEILTKKGEQEEITLNVVFLPDFPLSFPKVLLGKDDYERTKYLPHVQVDRLVCTFENQASPNPEAPAEVIIETIRRAKRTLEDGINGTNRSEDFNDEFIAYWDSKYSDRDTVLDGILLLIERPIESNIKIIQLEKAINKISYLIHQDEGIAERFKGYLEDYNLKYEEVPAYFLGAYDSVFEPPYELTNKTAIQLAKSINPDRFNEYKRYLNNNLYPKLALFSKNLNGGNGYFGWFHKSANLNRNGFRPGTLNTFKVLSTFESNSNVIRVNPEVYTPNRLVKRSSGSQLLNIQNPLIYTIAGLGSIGSNLVHFLKSDPQAEFRLIDEDKLKVENIGRHLLGFNHLNWKKTLGIKDYLKLLSPTRPVTTRESSIYQIVNHESDYINQSNFLIVCIGEGNIEKWLASKLLDNTIRIPIFFVWVEPYLVGGHCIYITPSSNNYNDLFDQNGLFKFNVIHEDEYLKNNPILSLREAGCQTNFTPYSADNVLKFVGSLNSEITKVIQTQEQNSRRFTWVGDKSVITELKLQLSDHGAQLQSESMKENKL